MKNVILLQFVFVLSFLFAGCKDIDFKDESNKLEFCDSFQVHSKKYQCLARCYIPNYFANNEYDKQKVAACQEGQRIVHENKNNPKNTAFETCKSKFQSDSSLVKACQIGVGLETEELNKNADEDFGEAKDRNRENGMLK